MREVLNNMLGPGGIFATFMILLFGANGYLERRSKIKSGKTTTHQEVLDAKFTEDVENNPSIAERWQKYADDIEQRLSKRIESLSKENECLSEKLENQSIQLNVQLKEVEAWKNRESLYIDYAGTLRHHITMKLPPPPPDWPEGLRKADYWNA